MRISFSWSTRREGNNGYVLETSSSGERREFGPMEPRLVMPFVEARRRVIAMRAQAEQADYVCDDFTYLEEENPLHAPHNGPLFS